MLPPAKRAAAREIKMISCLAIAYAVGGARGEVCEKTGPVAGTMSSGSGMEAIGFSKETDGATSNCAGV